ncbi:MAG: hypothetical protein ACYTBZ_24680, partial [Planctomycetota bacterium]
PQNSGLQTPDSSVPKEPNSGGMGKPSLPVADQSSSPSVNEGQLLNNKEDEHDDQTNPKSPELEHESEEQKLMKHINQLCLKMLQDPPALMRFLSNPYPMVENDEDDDQDDDETNLVPRKLRKGG